MLDRRSGGEFDARPPAECAETKDAGMEHRLTAQAARRCSLPANWPE